MACWEDSLSHSPIPGNMSINPTPPRKAKIQPLVRAGLSDKSLLWPEDSPPSTEFRVQPGSVFCNWGDLALSWSLISPSSIDHPPGPGIQAALRVKSALDCK